MSDSSPPDYFATTHWSVLISAGSTGTPQSEEALEELCRRYWFPLYAYARHGGTTHADAEDLVQGFFSHFLRKNYLEPLKREHGRFRAFLMQCFKNHACNEKIRANRQKRGGQIEHVPFDWTDADEKFQSHLQSAETPERLFDQAWVITLLERVLAQLGKEMQAKGKADLFEILKPGLTVEGGTDYQEIAVRLNLSQEAVRMAAMRLRQHYQELIRLEILETCHPDHVEQEIWTLLNAFSA
jgi:RNA polymerase sigma factor (sigma-70 family)